MRLKVREVLISTFVLTFLLFPCTSAQGLVPLMPVGWASVSVSQDGNYIVAGSVRGRVCLFRRDSGTPLWTYDVPGHFPLTSISENGDYIAVAARALYFFEKSENVPRWVAFYPVEKTAISADGSYIAAVSEDRVFLFSREDNIPIWTYRTGKNCSVSISSDGRYITTAGGEALYLFRRRENTAFWDIPLWKSHYPIKKALVSHNGNFIVAVDENRVYLFDSSENTPSWIFDAEKACMASISADGSHIAAACSGTLYLFSNTDNSPLWFMSDQISAVGISADANYIAAGGGSSLYLFKKEKNTPFWSSNRLWGIQFVSISSDGSCIAVGGEHEVCAFNQSGTRLWSYSYTPTRERRGLPLSGVALVLALVIACVVITYLGVKLGRKKFLLMLLFLSVVPWGVGYSAHRGGEELFFFSPLWVGSLGTTPGIALTPHLVLVARPYSLWGNWIFLFAASVALTVLRIKKTHSKKHANIILLPLYLGCMALFCYVLFDSWAMGVMSIPFSGFFLYIKAFQYLWR